MRIININDIPYKLPDSWEEIITGGHYMAAVRMITGTDPMPIRQYELFKTLTGFDPVPHGLTALGEQQLSEHLVASVLPCFDFMFDSERLFVINPIPFFEHDGVRYTGPSAKLNNQTGFQWEKTHHLQVMHDGSKDIKLLEQIVYTNYTCETRPAETTPLPEDLIYGIMLWYGKCEKWWSAKFPWLFPAADPEEIPTGNAPATGREVKDLLFRLAGGKLNADWDIVRSRTRQDIIYALDEMEKERERIESQRKA